MVQTRPNLPDRFSALPQDLKQQLATHKLYTAHDPNAPYTCVDACAWFNALCVRLEASLPKVARTLDELQNNAYLDQSIALADIASYLLGDENLICAALLFLTIVQMFLTIVQMKVCAPSLTMHARWQTCNL